MYIDGSVEEVLLNLYLFLPKFQLSVMNQDNTRKIHIQQLMILDKERTINIKISTALCSSIQPTQELIVPEFSTNLKIISIY
jgi:hypothetical protein